MEFYNQRFTTNSIQTIANGFSSKDAPLGTNYSAIVLHEVAMEGLDGITMNMLKHVLETRRGFQLQLNDDFVLEILKSHVDKGRIAIYELPKPRAFLEPENRYKEVDSDGYLSYPKEDREDSYPLKVIEDGEIRGSCSTYETRKHLKTVDVANDSIVFVASQTERGKAILGANYDPLLAKKLMPVQWVILERIGRSRYHGEITVGPRSLQKWANLAAKDLFYHRKFILKNGLMTKQIISMRGISQQTLKGRLFHLPHYFDEFISEAQRQIFNMINLLKESGGIAPYDTAKEIMGSGEKIPKAVKMIWNRFIETGLTMPYSEIYPDSNPKEWKTKNGLTKYVKVVKLKDPNVDPQEVLMVNRADDEDDELEDDQDDTDVSNDVQLRGDRTLIWQAFQVVDDAGPEGMTSRTLGLKMNLNRFSLRSILKNLERRGVIEFYMRDQGRQKTTHYVSKRHKNDQAEKQNKPETNNWARHSRSDGAPTRNQTVTEKQENRIKMVMEFINERKVVTQLYEIYKYITVAEAKAGLTVRMDRKSFKRILDKLANAGKIRLMNVKIDTDAKLVNLACLPDIKENDPLIKATIEKEKQKSDFKPKTVPVIKAEEESISISLNEMSGAAKESPNKPVIEFKNKRGFDYGYKPKFVKTRELHLLLYYLTRDYTGKKQDKSVVIEDAKRQGIDVTEEIEKELEEMDIFQPDINWKTFINPLPHHPGYGDGWVLLCDAILRMPLSIFLQVVCINYDVPGLAAYLDHPLRRHYLIKSLPDEIRTLLLARRKYAGSTMETVRRLVYMGLAQLAPYSIPVNNESHFVYVNTRTRLLDTRSSANAYHKIEDKEYPVLNYELKSNHDVEKFWHDLYNLAITTCLGRSAAGQTITLEQTDKKPEMIAAVKGSKVNEVDDLDVFVPPGDSRGAGGFDSSLFIHLKRNWNWTSHGEPTPLTNHPNRDSPFKPSDGEESPAKKQKMMVSSEMVKKKGAKRKLPGTEESESPFKGAGVPFKKAAKPAKTTRVIKERVKGSKKPYYDDIDKEALKLMTKLRVDWTKEEDTLMLVSRIAGSYLCQNALATANSMVPYCVGKFTSFFFFNKMEFFLIKEIIYIFFYS